MSAYINFYLRSATGEYLPVGTFCRISEMYQAAQEIIPWEQYHFLTRSNLHEMIDTCDNHIIECEKEIKECENSIQFLKSLDKPVEEIMEERESYIESINEYIEELSGWKAAKHVICVYNDFLDEAHDTQFEGYGPKLKEDQYLLGAHECEFPTDKLVFKLEDKE